jgi:hypothetical protein
MKFKVGDRVRSYDFQPLKSRKEMFIEGVILKIDIKHYTYAIEVEYDSEGYREAEMVNTPIETFSDYEGRITLL